MNFFDTIHETQITRRARQPRPVRPNSVPLHRQLFPIQPSPGDIARKAVREVLG